MQDMTPPHTMVAPCSTYLCTRSRHFYLSSYIADMQCSDANLELVDKFCYLGDMLSVDGDADAAVETRIRIG